MKRLLKIGLVIALLYIALIPVYLASSTNSVYCKGVSVDLTDSSDLHFVTKRQLLNAAYGSSGKMTGRPINFLPMRSRSAYFSWKAQGCATC